MKICMITSSYPRHEGDGAGAYVKGLSEALAKRGHEIHVVAPYDPDIRKTQASKVHVHRFRYAPVDSLCLAGHGRALEADVQLKSVVPLLMVPFSFSALLKVLFLHQRERFDLLHGHWAVPGGVISGILSHLMGLPMILTLHGSDVFIIEHNKLYAKMAQVGFTRAKYVTAVSEDLRKRATAIGLRQERSLVVPCGVDITHYKVIKESMRSQLGIPDDALVIGALGRLVHKKGFKYLISAMPEIVASLPKTYCVIGGGGDLHERLIAQAQRLQISEHVLLPGYIDWQKTPSYFAMCDVFAVPSIKDEHGNVDGLPIVLLEAMASKCPIVASQVAGIPSVVRDRKNGLLVPPGNANALASALIEILEKAELRSHLGKQAFDSVSRDYGWSVVSKQMLSVYERALNSEK